MIYALIALIAIVTALLLLLRTNTGVVFLAVCAGSVLLAAAGKDTDLLAHSLGNSQPSTNVVQAAVVLLPAIISAVVLRKRVVTTKMFLAVIPAFCSAIVALTLVYPFLSGSFQTTLTSGKGWSLIAQYYELIVVIGIVSSLFTLAFTVPKHHGDKHHKKGKH